MKAPRTFMLNGQRLADPDPTKTPEQVKEMYANDYPELTTCTVAFSKKDGKEVYEFKKAAGTKG
jgi:PRTRC genetic system protein C